MRSPHTPVRYWLQDQPNEPQNFGDYMTELFLRRLFVLPSFPANIYHLVGSVISDHQIIQDLNNLPISNRTGKVAFWGCGMRDAYPLLAETRKKAHFFGIRGPLSRQVLGLPEDTPLGDPGLFVPILHPVSRQEKPRGGSLCILHILDPKSEADAKRETGADRVIRAGIPGNEAALCAILETIATAAFVLSGALHGAITACAYGVPFAYYDSGYVDVPFKWADFAASVNIPCRFAKTVEEGKRIYADEIAPNYRPLPLAPLLAAAPFAARPMALMRTLLHDRKITEDTAKEMIAALQSSGADNQVAFTSAQEAWLRDDKATPDISLPSGAADWLLSQNPLRHS